jgi:hypothetical protein
MTTKVYNSLLDDREITMWRSPSGLRHVGSWYGQVACGAFVDSHNGWKYDGLTSLRWVGKISRLPNVNHMCRRCASQYKDVNVDA